MPPVEVKKLLKEALRNPADEMIKRIKDTLDPRRVQLRQMLDSLSARKQIAFALCCCERLYSGYKAFVDSSSREDGMRPILDRLWSFAFGEDLTAQEVNDLQTACQSQGLADETIQKDWDAFSAIFCLESTVRALQGNISDNVLLACEECQDAVYQKLWSKHCPKSGGIVIVMPDQGFEIQARIDSDPPMIREIETELFQLHLLMAEKELTGETVGKLLDLNRIN
jgi:hypothetical protein